MHHVLYSTPARTVYCTLNSGCEVNHRIGGSTDTKACTVTVVADEIGNNHLGVYKQPCSPRHFCD